MCACVCVCVCVGGGFWGQCRHAVAGDGKIAMSGWRCLPAKMVFLQRWCMAGNSRCERPLPTTTTSMRVSECGDWGRCGGVTTRMIVVVAMVVVVVVVVMVVLVGVVVESVGVTEEKG